MCNTAEEVRMDSKVMNSCGPLHIDEQRLNNQLETEYSSFMLVQDVAWKTFREG